MTDNRSQTGSSRKDDFLGLYVSSDLKRDVEQSAERKDRSISGEARQRLQAGNGDGDA
jgi:hypothetical protein